jgi:hypothetical protein
LELIEIETNKQEPVVPENQIIRFSNESILEEWHRINLNAELRRNK